MFTKNVLHSVVDPELKGALHLDKGDKDNESRINWVVDNVNEIVKYITGVQPSDDGSLQQSDLLREFYLSIATKNLKFAYDHTHIFKPSDMPKHFVPPNEPIDIIKAPEKPVIIVGAGMSGLVAAYELKKVHYNVEILEMSQRFGGRVKTLDQKDGYDRGLHTDAGAMRLPQEPDAERPIREMIHYLTDFYGMKKFKLKPVPFSNASPYAFYHFYGHTTRIDKWKDCQFSEYWPGWDEKIKGKGITNVDDYYDATVDIVVQLLKNRLRGIPPWDTKSKAKQWDLWTDNWCQFSFGSFLRSTLTGIKSQLAYDDKLKPDDPTLENLKHYLPWPEQAITAYTVFNYTLGLDVSLVSTIQDGMGKWWSDHMHSLEGGLSALPNAFTMNEELPMEPLITYNRTVTKVEYHWKNNREKSVRVSGIITSSGESFSVEGRSVILTVPLHILRGIEIVNVFPKANPLSINEAAMKPFPRDFQQAIEDISYSPSTKIMLQYKKQFWNTGKDAQNDITGGFSKTNLPIGQLHYPTQVERVQKKSGTGLGQFTYVPTPIKEGQKGILMVYTWKAEALMFGALTEEMAIRNCVEQINEIHPGTKKYFEMGKRQAWASDPTTLGAFAMLRPRDYISVLYLMQNSWRNVYFGGEAISFANGWIQGALESGLRAAYQLYADDQPSRPKEDAYQLYADDQPPRPKEAAYQQYADDEPPSPMEVFVKIALQGIKQNF